MKAFTKILAVAIAAAGVISAAGCAGGASSAKVATNANWNVRTSASVEKSFTERWLNNTEVAEYEITFSEGANNTYSVSYNEGATYKTQFGMTYFDWSEQKNLPEGYAPEENVKELVYFFKTEWEISGKYVFKANGDKHEFNDSATSVCYYRLAGNNLQPVYSRQDIKSTAPNALSASSIDNAYVEISGYYITYYNYDCTKASILHWDDFEAQKVLATKSEYNPPVTEVSVNDKAGHSVFDNSQLRAAVRAFNLSGGTHTFNVLVPQNGGLQPCMATCTSPVTLNKEDEQQQKIIKALEACQENNPDYIFFTDNAPEGEEARNYRFNAVAMGIVTDDPMTGASPTLWYSTVENSDVNYSKSVLLRMTTPLSFGLGTINYTLKSLNLVANAK